jgi:type VI secretion system protein VasD
MTRATQLFAMLLAAAFAAGQVAAGEPTAASATTSVELTVVGGPDLNPNGEGRASPVVVRIFDLAAVPRFEAADYATLFEKVETLKGTVLALDELMLRPGDIQERNRDLQSNVRALGVAAGFRQLDGAVWHLTIPLQVGRRNFLLVHLDRNRIRFETIDSK